ncbi:class I adenylate-forming enzyme family protein [Kitasatospora cineracea]
MNVSTLEPPRVAWPPSLLPHPGHPAGGADRAVLPDLARVEALLARTSDVTGAPAGLELADVMRELDALALPTGSVVMISLPNGVRVLRWLFAALLTGHVPALVPPSTAAARWDEVTARFRPALVVGSPARLGGITGTPLEVAGTWAVRPAAAVRLHGPGQLILLTSGTSGAATGCLHDASALLHNADLHAEALGITGDDTLLVSLPVHYSFALVAQVFAALRTGAALALSRPPFSVPGYLEQLAAHRVTVSSLTPTLVKDLVAAGVGTPGTLRVLSVGGQALEPALTAALLAGRPGGELYLTYGLTEAGPRVATLAAHREPAHRYASLGRPLSGVGLSLRPDPSGGRELLVSSPTVYRERIGAAAPGCRRGALVAPGVLATGDLAELEDGYLFVRGRTTDFAVLRGEKVSLASVRRTAKSLEGVVHAATRIDPDGDAYRISLFVDGAAPPDAAGLRRRLNTLLSPHERPAEVEVLPAPADMLLK